MAERNLRCVTKLKAVLRVKNENLRLFDAKLRSALLVSLRSAIFREIQVVNLLVTLPTEVNYLELRFFSNFHF